MIDIQWINQNTTFIEKEFTEAIFDGIGDWLMGDVRPVIERATSTWSHKPVFNYNRSPWSWDIVGDRFVWVNSGTRKQWMRFSQDWRSKSQPGSLSAGPGGGRVVGKRKRPKVNPGIKAREFDYQAMKQEQGKLVNKLTVNIQKRSYRMFI